MKVPNAQLAIVDIRKLSDYCLNHAHPRGRHKARVFYSALGMKSTDAAELKATLLDKIVSEDCEIGREDQHGVRYIVDFIHYREKKKAMIRSTWIIHHGDSIPRLTSCFIL